jgi:hypothetical protein
MMRRIVRVLFAALVLLAPVLAQAQAVTDTFDRANGGIGANWTALDGTLSISSNAVSASTSPSSAIYTAATFANNQYSQTTCASGAGLDWSLLIVRAQDASNYYVSFSQCATAGTIIIFKVVGGTSTSLNSGSASGGGNGSVQRLSITGNVLTYTIDGTTELTATDGSSTFASGSPGFGEYTAVTSDNWEGGPTVGGSGASNGLLLGRGVGN